MIREWENGSPVVAAIKNSNDESGLTYRIRTAYYRLVARLTNVEILEHFTGFGLYDRSVVEHIRANFRDPYPYFRGMIVPACTMPSGSRNATNTVPQHRYINSLRYVNSLVDIRGLLGRSKDMNRESAICSSDAKSAGFFRCG